MPRAVWEIEINSETPREELERCVVEAEHTSDRNVQGAAARARAELWRREQQVWTTRFNAESKEHVKAQRIQEAQITKQIEAQERLMGQQIEVAKKHAETAEGAAQAVRQSARATVVLAILTAILAIIATLTLFLA